MSNILVLKSSILGEYSQSNKLIEHAIEGKQNVIVRDLGADPAPVLDMNVITALSAAEADLSDEQKAILQLSNQFIEELKTADTLIIGAPMYNFMVPTQLKNWFDLVARAGVTFKYTETGPVGLIDDKKVLIMTTRGGLHKDSERNSIESYLTTMLGFIGITSVEFIYAEALNVGEDAAKESRDNAQELLAEAI